MKYSKYPIHIFSCFLCFFGIQSIVHADSKDEIIKKVIECLSNDVKLVQASCLVNYIEGVQKTEDKTVSTKDMINKINANEYAVVDPKDLQLGPKKFIGRPIELKNMQCYYADINEYRCWSSGSASVTIFSPKIVDGPENAKFDDVCGKSKNTSGPACRRTIRLVPKEWDEDQPSAFGKRTIIRTPQIELVAAVKRPQR